jgi:hypothetical protein
MLVHVSFKYIYDVSLHLVMKMRSSRLIMLLICLAMLASTAFAEACDPGPKTVTISITGPGGGSASGIDVTSECSEQCVFDNSNTDSVPDTSYFTFGDRGNNNRNADDAAHIKCDISKAAPYELCRFGAGSYNINIKFYSLPGEVPQGSGTYATYDETESTTYSCSQTCAIAGASGATGGETTITADITDFVISVPEFSGVDCGDGNYQAGSWSCTGGASGECTFVCESYASGAIGSLEVTDDSSGSATFQCTGSVTPGTPQCSDGIDNDGDGDIDCADPGCHPGYEMTNPCDTTDTSEWNPSAVTPTEQPVCEFTRPLSVSKGSYDPGEGAIQYSGFDDTPSSDHEGCDLPLVCAMSCTGDGSGTCDYGVNAQDPLLTGGNYEVKVTFTGQADGEDATATCYGQVIVYDIRGAEVPEYPGGFLLIAVLMAVLGIAYYYRKK